MDEQIILEKQKLRKKIRALKGKVSSDFYNSASKKALEKLELLPEFKEAKEILAYWSLPQEVHTQEFIEKWNAEKQFYLPVISGDNLEIKLFEGEKGLIKNSQFKVWEPQGDILEDSNLVDLVIVPGMAFDNKGNRLGRGKGYYDRLLTKLNAFKVGLCYDFQLIECVPNTGFDITMNKVVWN